MRRDRHLRGLPAHVVRLVVFLLTTFAASVSLAADNKQVILLHSFGTEMRPWSDYAKSIREELRRHSPWPLDITDHSLVSARYNNSDPDIPFIDYLTALFAQKHPDVIVCIGAPASNFVQRYRDRLFASIPMVLTTLEKRRVQYSILAQNDAVVPIDINYKVSIENILSVLPDTKSVAVVNGTSPNERFWSDAIRKDALSLMGRVELTFWDNLSFEDILRRATRLPPHSAILWEGMNVDAAGVVHDGDEAFKKLHAVSNAPIFGYTEPLIGQGAVGGPFNAVLDTSRATADAVVRILGGEKAGDIRVPPLQFSPPRYDWREMQRWGISESRLPPGSEVYFRKRDIWETHRWQILSVSAALLLQAFLIMVLLHQRRRLRVAEATAQLRLTELARVNRVSTVGQLTATIAHELNQPLGAILTNAETLEAMLESPSLDLNEVREIVVDIRRDDQRAGEIIKGVRALLQNTPLNLTTLDLNEVVVGTLGLLSALAASRQVATVTYLHSGSLPVRADRVQLEQVLLNLIINGMDALSTTPLSARKIEVRTSIHDQKEAELRVSDNGPGIAADKIKEVFEPFYSTKPQGMGMGLSIVRSIIEAHHGRITAENQGGAVFQIRLPLT